jgi:hypothetical protein
MNTQTLLWFKLGAIVLLIIIYSYGFYKWVPLIVKVRVGEKKSILSIIRNMTIMIVYFVVTMVIMLSASRPLPIYFQRDNITSSLSEINDILIELEEKTFDQDGLKLISDKELILALETAENGIELVSSQRYGRAELNYYIRTWQITHPLRIIRTILLQGKTLDPLDKRLLRDTIEISKNAKIRDKSIYKLSLNLYTVPEELTSYFDEMSELYAKYNRLKK